MKALETFALKYKAAVAHTFVIHGNYSDYAATNGGGAWISVKDALARTVAGRQAEGEKQIVVLYNRAEGCKFLQPSMKKDLLEYLATHKYPFEVNDMPVAPEECFPIFDFMLKNSHSFNLILEDTEFLFPMGDAAGNPQDRYCLNLMLCWARDKTIAKSGNVIFLFTPDLSGLNQALLASAAHIESIYVTIPDLEQRLEFITSKEGDFEYGDGMTARGFATLTAGLMLYHIEDVIYTAKTAGQKITRQGIKDRKSDIIAQEFSSVLEMPDLDYGFDVVGGTDLLKGHFQTALINPFKSGDTKRVPKGYLCCGAPGTGKTYLIRALAKEAGVNFVSLNPAKIFQQWVGATERNLEKALMAIRALAPTIVLIDEADQAFSRGSSGDSGTSNRVFKRILEEMSDPKTKGKIVWFLLTNRPDTLDPALKRSGRIDKRIFFPQPNEVERKLVLESVLKGKGYDVEVTPVIVANTKGWAHSDLTALVEKAEETEVTVDSLVAASRAIKPSTATPGTQHMINAGLAECNDLSLLPPEYRDKDFEKLAKEVEAENKGREIRSL